MKLPLSLLKAFLDLPESSSEIERALTLLGIEVDAISSSSQDTVFELSLTPNLGYCLSAKGIARELSAFLNIPLKSIPPENISAKSPEKIKISIENQNLCPRYIGQRIENVKIKPSPLWLQQVLESAGIRSINNAVDITSYILLKWGQPMHAFDGDKIEKGEIFVSSSSEEIPFLCLDDVERLVPKGSLFISDGEKPIALAGIMGGQNSSVSESTTTIFLETAFFDPTTIRITSKKMGLRSESSLRFEKGIDPDVMEHALAEAVELFCTLCEGEIKTAPSDHYSKPFSPKLINCRSERVQKILGSKISVHEIGEIFERLGFKTKLKEPGTWMVSVPVYRFDVTEEIDLIEEVARIYGYNAIEKKAPLYTSSTSPHDPLFIFEKLLREHLNGLGLQEILTSDLISPKLADLAIEAKLPHIEFLQVLHAKSEEYSILRPSLLPGFLQVAQYNIDQKNPSFAGFEIGHIYFEEDKKKVEIPAAALFLTGKSKPYHWHPKPVDFDFYDLKGILENLFESLQISGISCKKSSHPSFHPGRQASIYLEDRLIGSFGEVHPNLLRPLDIKQRVLYAELNLSPLLTAETKSSSMQPLPQFPATDRDWTLPLAKRASIQPVLDAIHSFDSKLLEKAELLDLFVSDTQNVTFRFTYRDSFKTISFEEAEKEHARLMQNVLASLR